MKTKKKTKSLEKKLKTKVEKMLDIDLVYNNFQLMESIYNKAFDVIYKETLKLPEEKRWVIGARVVNMLHSRFFNLTIQKSDEIIQREESKWMLKK